MQYVWIVVLAASLLACAGASTPEVNDTSSGISTKPAASLSDTPRTPDPPNKSPHGYIIPDAYRPDIYGGFIGDCASDENFPYYWDCMSENSGNDFN